MTAEVDDLLKHTIPLEIKGRNETHDEREYAEATKVMDPTLVRAALQPMWLVDRKAVFQNPEVDVTLVVPWPSEVTLSEKEVSYKIDFGQGIGPLFQKALTVFVSPRLPRPRSLDS